MGQSSRVRALRKANRGIVTEEVQRAEVQLLIKCGRLLFERRLFGRLKWLLTGK